MRLAQVELRSYGKNVQLQLVKKWPESASPTHWPKLDDRRTAPSELRQPVGFFTRYRSRACEIKTGHAAIGTAGFITNATARTRTVRSQELCKLRIFCDWTVCVALKVSYSNFYEGLLCHLPFFLPFLYNDFRELNSWHIYLCRSRQLPLLDRAFRRVIFFTVKYYTVRIVSYCEIWEQEIFLKWKIGANIILIKNKYFPYSQY